MVINILLGWVFHKEKVGLIRRSGIGLVFSRIA
jgi:hypothetical protein